MRNFAKNKTFSGVIVKQKEQKHENEYLVDDRPQMDWRSMTDEEATAILMPYIDYFTEEEQIAYGLKTK